MTNKAEQKASKDWHPADIKAALEKQGWTMRALAAHHGLTSSTSFSRALTSSMPANERRIADAIGVPPEAIWPSRYNPDGTLKPRGLRGMRRPVKSTGTSNACNGKAQQAA